MEIQEKIGDGQTSIVYKGVYNNEIVAIKKLYKKKYISQEINILQKLHHENIVNYIEHIDDCLILEYCNLGNLTDYSSNNFLTEKTTKYLFKQLFNGLKYLYNNHILHRDLKPDNILLHNSHSKVILKIADFNFAKSKIDLNHTTCGTPLYMAPEIIFTNNYTDKCDLWSCGIILYECVYNKHPFDPVHTIDQLLKKIKRPIEYNYNVSNECIDLMKKLLQINPEKRINWENVFRHRWFVCYEEKISYESIESTVPDIFEHPEIPIKKSMPIYTRILSKSLNYSYETLQSTFSYFSHSFS